MLSDREKIVICLLSRGSALDAINLKDLILKTMNAFDVADLVLSEREAPGSIEKSYERLCE